MEIDNITDKGILKNKSETLLPRVYSVKPKILIIFGNPATHSIKYGMFYYCTRNKRRHPMWSKFQVAGLVKEIELKLSKKNSQRKKLETEALERKRQILDASISENFSLGLSTFYSFPTPCSDDSKYSNVIGVIKLFRPIIKEINKMEIQRINNYPFTRNATLLFVQKDTYYFYQSTADKLRNKCIYWPAVSRRKGAPNKGEDLLKLINKQIKMDD